MPRLCPYCRASLEGSEDSVTCPSCSTEHHADCWSENGGCAVVGCSEGPKSTPGQEETLILPPIEDAPPPVQVELDDGNGRSRRRVAPAVAIIATFAVLAAGVAGAFLVASAGDEEVVLPPGSHSNQADTGVADTGRSGTNGRAAANKGPERAEDLTNSEIVEGATEVLNKHHELLKRANGDPSSPYAEEAYKLLSDRKREYEEADSSTQTGFEYWITKRESENLRIGQVICLPGTVQLRDWDPQEGVAFVYADFGTYTGETWVKYEDGKWTYDAGYGHVPERRAQWEYASNKTDLFSPRGGSC